MSTEFRTPIPTPVPPNRVSYHALFHLHEGRGEKEVWTDIWEILQRTKVTVFHVDAYSNNDILERLYNSVADNWIKISQAGLKFPQKEDHEGLAKWAHQKYRHLGEKATYRWAQEHGIIMSLDMIKTIIAQCPVCQYTHKHLVLNIVKGQLGRGKLPGAVLRSFAVTGLPSWSTDLDDGKA